MKTLGDFKRFVGLVRQMYGRCIGDEVKRNTGRESSYSRDLRNDLVRFNGRGQKVLDAVGDAPDSTKLTGEALDEAKHMLLCGR